MKTVEKLRRANESGKFICVGLDTDLKKIPAHLLSSKNPVFEFNKQIIEATAEGAAAFKLNFAFYEKFGSQGLETLDSTIKLIPEDILIIGDAKRGDIGNTSTMYAESIFNCYNCDSVTVHPYMGEDSVKPFMDFSDKLIFILALTSNPGADDFEKLKLADGSMLFQQVIKSVHKWNKGNCGIVFGATKIEELKENIGLIGNLPVLLPGVGAQGGSLEDVVRVFKSKGRTDYIINVSRGVIYKSGGKDFAEAARTEVLNLNSEVVSIIN